MLPIGPCSPHTATLQEMKKRLKDEYIGFGGSPNNVRKALVASCVLNLSTFPFHWQDTCQSISMPSCTRMFATNGHDAMPACNSMPNQFCSLSCAFACPKGRDNYPTVAGPVSQSAPGQQCSSLSNSPPRWTVLWTLGNAYRPSSGSCNHHFPQWMLI